MRTRQRVFRFALALAAGACIMQSAAAGPCDAPDYRAFDFWLGNWEVTTPAGKLAGTSRIEREYEGCVIHEHYAAAGRGYSGESLNMFDAARKVWHQTWVDTDGTLLLLEGRLVDGRMVLEGQTANVNSLPTRHRITWSRNADAGVQQVWESTDAKGEWAVVFNGKYTRKQAQ
jgi:hypothetical protein